METPSAFNLSDEFLYRPGGFVDDDGKIYSTDGRSTQYFDDRTPSISPNPIATSTCTKENSLEATPRPYDQGSYLSRSSSSSSLGLIDSKTMKADIGNDLLSDLSTHFEKSVTLSKSQNEKDEEDNDVSRASIHLDKQDLDDLDAEMSGFESDDEEASFHSGPNDVVSSLAPNSRPHSSSTDQRYVTADSGGFRTSIGSGFSISKTPALSTQSIPSVVDSGTQLNNINDIYPEENDAQDLATVTLGTSRLESNHNEGRSFLMPNNVVNPFDDGSGSISPVNVDIPFGSLSVDQLQTELQAHFDDGDFAELSQNDKMAFLDEEEKENKAVHRFLQEEAMTSTRIEGTPDTSMWSINNDQPSKSHVWIDKPSWFDSLVGDQNCSKLSPSTLFAARSAAIGTPNEENGPRPFWGTEIKSPHTSVVPLQETSKIDSIENQQKIPEIVEPVLDTLDASSSCGRPFVSTPVDLCKRKSPDYTTLPGFSAFSAVATPQEQNSTAESQICTKPNNWLIGRGSMLGSRDMSAFRTGANITNVASMSAIHRCIANASLGANASALADILLKAQAIIGSPRPLSADSGVADSGRTAQMEIPAQIKEDSATPEETTAKERTKEQHDLNCRTQNSTSTTVAECSATNNRTPIVLEGFVLEKSTSGVLVINVTYEGKSYIGTLLDCNRIDWSNMKVQETNQKEIEKETIVEKRPEVEKDQELSKPDIVESRSTAVISSTLTVTSNKTNILKDRNDGSADIKHDDDRGRVSVKPKSVKFVPTAINTWDSVKLEFRNVARVSNTIRLQIVDGPFFVKCPEYRIDPMRFVKMSIYFKPTQKGLFSGQLEVSVENGQVISIPLEGRTVD